MSIPRFKPSKQLGQHFLTDKSAVKKVVLAADLDSKDIIMEIGPGTGILTKELAKKVKRVIAVEKDKKMIEVLKETLRGFDNVKVIHEDILKLEEWHPSKSGAVPFPEWHKRPLSIGDYKVVANLPFYLAAPVIRKFLEAEQRPQLIVFIIQKEVAQRICSKPPKMNLLAVSVQFYAFPKIISYVSKTSFWPKPKVDSAIIKFEIRNPKFEIDSKDFFRLVKAGFSQPRKQLINNLSKGLKLNKQKTADWLQHNNIKPAQRAESLTIENWLALAKSYTIN